jgi:hypothetical protein
MAAAELHKHSRRQILLLLREPGPGETKNSTTFDGQQKRATTKQARRSPMAFCVDMGFWNAMTLATITTTRFTQLPMLCVTGVTRDRIM